MAALVRATINDISIRTMLTALGSKAVPALASALYTEGGLIITDSQNHYVPVLTGALRSSGHVDQPVIIGKSVSVTLGFGGPATPYALIQHENLEFRHTVGQAKYLELPFMAACGTMLPRLAQTLGAAMG
jgi:hypothetical protein